MPKDEAYGMVFLVDIREMFARDATAQGPHLVVVEKRTGGIEMEMVCELAS
jgi:hypothetical protein